MESAKVPEKSQAESGENQISWTKERANAARIANLQKARKALEEKKILESHWKMQQANGVASEPKNTPQFTVSPIVEERDMITEPISPRASRSQQRGAVTENEEPSVLQTVYAVGSAIVLSALVSMGSAIAVKAIQSFYPPDEQPQSRDTSNRDAENGSPANRAIFRGQSMFK
jgi:hypothetical protein